MNKIIKFLIYQTALNTLIHTIINFLRRLIRVLSNPARLKLAITARLQPRLRRWVVGLLPETVSQPIEHLEKELAELRFSVLKLESREHLRRVGYIAPLINNLEVVNQEQP